MVWNFARFSYEIYEDVFNFGGTDNFWCATFERAVKKYISRPKNNKGLEKKYAQSKEWRELLKEELHFPLRGRRC